MKKPNQFVWLGAFGSKVTNENIQFKQKDKMTCKCQFGNYKLSLFILESLGGLRQSERVMLTSLQTEQILNTETTVYLCRAMLTSETILQSQRSKTS